MTESSEKFRLTKRHEEAALLVAEDRLTDAVIAARMGITDRQLRKWKQQPEFAAKVAEHVEQFAAVVLKRGIARLDRRVEALDDRWQRMQQVIDERAVNPSVQHVPGGSTGLIVHDVKGVGKGEDFQLIDLYAVDTGLLKELREHEKQAAQELGQWTEKRELTGKDGDAVFTILIDRRDGGDDGSSGG